MKSFIDKMRAALKPVPLLANHTGYGGECVIYDVNTIAYDKAKRTARVKATIVTDTMERGLELEGKLDEALVTLGDEALTNTVTTCARNGGGWLNDGDRHIRIAYYEVVIRGGRKHGG